MAGRAAMTSALLARVPREAANSSTTGVPPRPDRALRARELPALGTWSWDPEGGQGHCSSQACAILGLPPGARPDLEGLLECFLPESRAMLREAFRGCMQEGGGFDVEAVAMRPGARGVRVRLTCEAEWDAAAGCVRLAGAVHDLTPAAKTQQDLQESRRALEMLLGNLPGMAYRCANAVDWPMQFVSDGAWELTGYRPDQLMAGKPSYSDLMNPAEAAEIWERVQDALARRRRFQLTYRLRTPWGEKWVWEQGCGVYEPDGSVRWLEGFICDVTHAKQVQAELNRLNRSLEDRVRERTTELQTANAELEAFAYSIAHDLRAPMTSLAGFSRLLEQALPDATGRSGHYLRRIAENVTQMSDLTDALLALARLTGVDIQCEPVDLAELAHTAVEHLREQEPNRRVEAAIAAPLPAHGDPRLLQQVLSNLVGNAWKFSRDREVAWVEVAASAIDGEQVFHVRDNGVGFDMAHAGHLFGAFRRLHGAGEFEGTGIGLALVRKIVHRHGGRVWAESEPGVGTTVSFTLPPPPRG